MIIENKSNQSFEQLKHSLLSVGVWRWRLIGRIIQNQIRNLLLPFETVAKQIRSSVPLPGLNLG
jgi:hypothetical protein